MKIDYFACYTCAKCTSGCPTTYYVPSFKPHVIVALAKLNHEELVDNALLWDCVHCKRCERRCPQEVSPFLILTELKNKSFKLNKEHVPKGFETIVNLLKESGLATRIQTIFTADFDEYSRKDLDLPPLPRPNTEAINSALTNLGFFEKRALKEKR